MEQCIMTGKILSLILLLHCGYGAQVSAGKCFTMSPDSDVYLLSGSDLQLNCTLKTPSNYSDCPNDDFSLNKTRITKGSQELPGDIFDYIVEENTLMMTIQNVTPADSASYNCLYGNKESTQAFTMVKVGEPPGPPENLSCIALNYQRMSCSFSLSKQPVNMPFDWKIEYKSGRMKGNVSCSNVSESGIRCLEFPFLTRIWCHIFIEGKNKDFMRNVSKSFKVMANESIVKPDPVHQLGYSKSNDSRTVELHWYGPTGLRLPSEVVFALDYKIRVTSEWDNRTVMIENAMEAYKVYNLTDLIPFVNYTVTVTTKPSAAHGDIYWSDGSSVYFTTPSEVSEHSVSMTTGSYLMLECGQENMCPIIYWKNPARKYWNGQIIGYKITVEELELQENLVPMPEHISKRNFGSEPEYRIKRLVKPETENFTEMAVSGVLTTSMSRNKDYRVNMMLINSEGISTNRSELLIRSWSKGQALKPLWVSVESVDTSVFISWDIHPKYCGNITSVTYYWCLLDTEKQPFNSRNVSCKDNFDWYIFNITDGCRNKSGQIVKTYNQPYNIKYAVSVEMNGISGGLIWEKFRFRKQNVPDKPLYNVDRNGNSLIVEILYGEYYDSEGGPPEKYSVVYSECEEDKQCNSDGTVEEFPANFTNPVYKIDNLKSGTKYSVYLTSKNRFGGSIQGDKKEISIPEEESSTTVIILGTVFGALALIVVIVLVFLWCRKKHREWTESSKIKLPEMDETAMMEGSYQRKDSHKALMKSDDHDSGKGSSSQGSSLGQINPALQQDGIMASSDDPISHSNPATARVDIGSNGSSPLLENSKSSPVLFGYRKNDLGGSSNGQYTVDISDDESDEEAEKFEENKIAFKCEKELNEVPNHKEVPVEELNSASKQNNKSVIDGKLEVDYSFAALQQTESDTNVRELKEIPQTEESSKDKVAILPKLELKVRESLKKDDLVYFNKTLTNDFESASFKPVEIENEINDKSTTGKKSGDFDTENVENIKDLTAGSCIVMTSEGKKHGDIFVENSDPPGGDVDRTFEGSDSYGNAFENFCDSADNSIESPYKNPDEVSLGDGSTISDVTDSENINSDDSSHSSGDEKSESGDIEDEKFDNRRVVGEGDDVVVTCPDEIHNESEKLDVGTVVTTEQGIKSKSDVFQNAAVNKTTENINVTSDLGYPEQTGPDESMSEGSRSTSEPASLEPYIRAGFNSNGFVKSPKPHDAIVSEDLKKEALVKLLEKSSRHTSEIV